ncbi:MAG: cofactor-independent phosphoglycerate mutase [Clostridiales bacterium]|nr:cofactor-independent phosphoglycerate mutase [Clostridiales bacterium]
MKFLTILCDGMSDHPDERGNTPMSQAKKPNMDALAARGVRGLAQTVPAGMKPGSDVANLSVMGYDPKKYYTGRSPLEALSIGVPMKFSDVSYRLNLVTLSGEPVYDEKRMLDYSAGEITTAEAKKLIEFLAFTLPPDGLYLYPGVSYRHCLLHRDAETGAELTPPHDIADRVIGAYLPKGRYAEVFCDLMRQSNELLTGHPVNEARIKAGKNPANSIWLWGEGRKPALDNFYQLYGVRGAVISAVDLLKGIAVGAGLDVVEVPGATGNIHTDFSGKAAAAIETLRDHDYVYLHIEAPDECGHQGDRAGKTKAIELIDEKVVGPIVEALGKSGAPFRILVLPDHATPTALRSHVADPVPFLLYDSRTDARAKTGADGTPPPFTEESAKRSGLFVPSGNALLQRLIGG